MDKLLESITQKCLRENLIDEGQTEWLLYSLQCRVMNIGGFCILIASGLLVAPLPQVLVLNLGLAFLRKRTNGLHMPTKLSWVIRSCSRMRPHSLLSCVKQRIITVWENWSGTWKKWTC